MLQKHIVINELINIEGNFYNEIKPLECSRKMRIGKNKVYKVVNFGMVESYWKVGKEIVEDERNGESRAEYGKEIITQLSKRLTEDYS